MDHGIESPYRGQCLCGAVKYAVDAIGPRMAHCHCSMCRQFHGAANVSGEFVEFTLGTLLDAPELNPYAHVFAGSKARWDHIVDRLPQYGEGRESRKLG